MFNTTPIVLKSAQDSSVNFVWEIDKLRKIEARFVQRNPDYFIVYLSSHTGCNQSCRFCHLTATGQVLADMVSFGDFLIQANTVLNHYVSLGVKAKKVHFNWMARGEPLLHPFVTGGNLLFKQLAAKAEHLNLEYRFNISTIFPKNVDVDQLHKVWGSVDNIRLYVSLYSTDMDFRKRWLPKAQNPDQIGTCLQKLKDVVDITLHWALITDQNDSRESVEKVVQWIRQYDLGLAKVNLVRYNPNDLIKHGTESINYNQVVDALTSNVAGIKIVPKVGFDVSASCGMFV